MSSGMHCLSKTSRYLNPMSVISLLVFCYLLNISHGDIFEKQLYKRLLEDYNVLERPTETHSSPVIVLMKFTLLQLVDVVNCLLRNYF